MALDTLLDTLARDAGEEGQRLIDEAAAEAGRIRAAAAARAEARCAAALAARESELRARSDARRASYRREARIEALGVRKQLLDRVLAAVQDALPGALDAPERAPAIRALVGESLDSLPPGRALVRCHSRLATRVSESAFPPARIAILADDTVAGGVVVETEDRSVVVDNTLAARLRRRWPAIAIEIVRKIEAPG